MIPIGKLGRLPLNPQAHASVPKMERYAAQALIPPPPASQDWYSKIIYWPMLGNDATSDCTVAGVLHAIQQWRAYATGSGWVPSTGAALRLYTLFGYDPLRPAETDRGAYLIDVLKAWLQGFDIGDGTVDKLAAFAALHTQKPDELRYSVAWFGNAYLGIDLPLTVEGPLGGIEWDITPIGLTGQGAKGSLGGHLVVAVGYDPNWIYVISWGRLVRMSWSFWLAYGAEAYALLSSDFTNAPGTTPAHVPWQNLVHDWARLLPGSLTT